MLVLILAIRVKKVSHNRWFLFDSPHQLLQQMSTPVMYRAERHTTTSTDLRANRTALIRAHARGFHIIVVADDTALRLAPRNCSLNALWIVGVFMAINSVGSILGHARRVALLVYSAWRQIDRPLYVFIASSRAIQLLPACCLQNVPSPWAGVGGSRPERKHKM